MTLYEQWEDLLQNQTDDSFDKFWEDYCQVEIKVYSHILSHKDEALEGTFSQLVEKFKADPLLFMGFLDGINSSLPKEKDLKKVTESTKLKIQPDFEKLYYNMLKAKAPHLYQLAEWDGVLSEEKRKDITKEFKNSRTVHNTQKIGRNDPCPCGSGKKYKKCCGKNL